MLEFWGDGMKNNKKIGFLSFFEFFKCEVEKSADVIKRLQACVRLVGER